MSKFTTKNQYKTWPTKNMSSVSSNLYDLTKAAENIRNRRNQAIAYHRTKICVLMVASSARYIEGKEFTYVYFQHDMIVMTTLIVGYCLGRGYTV